MYNLKNKISAVFFDMDGVLIDSNAVIEGAWREAAEMYGKTISEEDIVRHIHGQPGPHTIQAPFSDLSLNDRKKVQAHIIRVENTAAYEPIAGVTELITSLDAAGVCIGIVTSGWREKIDRVTAMLHIQHCISVIVERDDVTRGKPFPDPYLLAAERLALTPERALVFEDSRSGVTSAVSAGTFCVGIGRAELIACGARFAIPDFTSAEVISRPGSDVEVSFGSGRVVAVSATA